MSLIPDPTDLPVARIHFPNIFNMDESYELFGVAIHWSDLEVAEKPIFDILAGLISRAKGTSGGFVNLRSTRRPRVYAESGTQDLVDLWAKAAAMNIPRDVLLTGCPATLHLCFWEKTRSFHNGAIGVSLNAITIDTNQVRFPGPLDETYSPK